MQQLFEQNEGKGDIKGEVNKVTLDGFSVEDKDVKLLANFKKIQLGILLPWLREHNVSTV